ncbi:MAG: DUF2203 family protein [bacterium]
MIHTQFKKFTLEEANELLPEIIALTKKTVQQLDDARMKSETEVNVFGNDSEASFHRDVNVLLDAWANRIAKLGVMPKGFFTCDFVTLNPGSFYCWNYGEKKIGYTHKVTESFKDRIPIQNPELQGFEVSLN